MINSKRLFDLIFSSFGLIFLSPLFIIVGSAIKATSSGPIFFRQIRVGYKGRNFCIFKFRTMKLPIDGAGPQITTTKDVRVTALGHLLRRSKIDELPQLINVVLGDMSLVGPRPEVPKYVALYTNEQRKVLEVRPGMTDLASIEYCNEAEILASVADPECFYVREIMPAKLALNLDYIQKQSLFFDVWLILQTLTRLRLI